MIRPLLTSFLLLAPCLASAADKEERVYEMRTYYAAPGKLEALHKRFRDHTVKLFEKHGITNVGYWTPIDNKENKLIFLLSYPSREAREKSWKAFMADPDWQKAFKESEKDGKLVERVENPFLVTTDYSPVVKGIKEGGVFELRTYTASPKNLEGLNARFRNHTIKLFEKHGATNLWYFNKMKDQKDADLMLIYFLAHKSTDAAKATFDAFRKDEVWLKVLKESEEKAGGKLTAAKDGVKSEFLKATDYSPIK